MSFEQYKSSLNGSPAIINLGCGRTNPPHYFGIDIQEFPGVNLVCDLTNGIPLPDKCADAVLAKDFLEHIPMGKPGIQIMEEIYRVMGVGAQFHFEVPSTDGNNMGAFQDPTHVSFWNQMKFNYFMADEYGKGFRSLYNINCHFKPVSIETYYNEWNVTYVRGVLERFKD